MRWPFIAPRSWQRAEAATQALGEHVVGELGDDALAGRLTHAARRGRVVEQAGERRGDLAGVLRAAHDDAGLAIGDGLRRPARGPGHLRHGARCGLEEDDAEALLLEPTPAVAADH